MLLSLNRIGFEFGARIILQDASWHIYPNERIGLIGPNGTGKSTLLKILIGEYSVSSGQVNRSRNLRIGYFHQDLQSLDTRDPILMVAMSAYEDALRIRQQIGELETICEQGGNEQDLHRLADLHHQFELAGGYEMEHRSAEVLEGLGFSTQDLNRSFQEFSGGWRMRVLLARMILQGPDILLLDEPTNHLDLPSIEWIERYLQSYPGTVIIVSHDRYFLDRMVTKIVHIDRQTLVHYSGNYSFFEQEKAIRQEMLQREYENQQDFIQQQERFVERFRAKATKAKQAQSIIKKLDRLERIEAPVNEQVKLNFRFEMGRQPGKVISVLEGVSKRYGELVILEDAHAEINRGQKIALIGANGKGKSTLLRLLAGTEGAEGIIKPGHQIDLSFYAQHQLEALDLDQDILGELKLCGSGKTEQELRELLGCFLFRGDDIFKKIRILSGGEKARVALAKTILGKGNFLLLDEPTNHLDISSVNMLIQALNHYAGTYVLVSHDRYFIQHTANTIWEIVDGKIKIFQGTYDEWVLQQTERAQKNQENQAPVALKASPVLTETQSTPIKQNSSAQKEKQKEEKKIRNRFARVEEELSIVQNRQQALESQLADPGLYADKQRFQETEKEYQTILQQSQNLQQEYETLFEQLVSFES